MISPLQIHANQPLQETASKLPVPELGVRFAEYEGGNDKMLKWALVKEIEGKPHVNWYGTVKAFLIMISISILSCVGINEAWAAFLGYRPLTTNGLVRCGIFLIPCISFMLMGGYRKGLGEWQKTDSA
jgi:hypothetical protein